MEVKGYVKGIPASVIATQIETALKNLLDWEGWAGSQVTGSTDILTVTQDQLGRMRTERKLWLQKHLQNLLDMLNAGYGGVKTEDRTQLKVALNAYYRRTFMGASLGYAAIKEHMKARAALKKEWSRILRQDKKYITQLRKAIYGRKPDPSKVKP
mgnify:CR=1 FL=1